MKELDYYKDVGILIGSRAFGGTTNIGTDWDFIVKAEDIPLHINCTRPDDRTKYTSLPIGVIDMFYTDTPQGLVNVQVVESATTFTKFQKARDIMNTAGKVLEKDKRINNWRLSMALAGIQKYIAWPATAPTIRSFLTKLKGLFK